MVNIGLIPAAGEGTRMRPITYGIPKEMVTVNGKPVIQYVVEGLVEAGIEKIYIITNTEKQGLEKFLKDGSDFGIKIAYIVQPKQEGLAHAINMGKDFIDGDFVVALGDDIFYPYNAFSKIIDFHKRKKADVTVSFQEVKKEKISKYGIIELNKDNRVTKIIEKPKPNETNSNKAVSGLYVFKPMIFDYIGKTGRGKKNEYQISDSIQLMIDGNKKVFSTNPGKRVPVGNIEELIEANKYFMGVNE